MICNNPKPPKLGIHAEGWGSGVTDTKIDNKNKVVACVNFTIGIIHYVLFSRDTDRKICRKREVDNNSENKMGKR